MSGSKSKDARSDVVHVLPQAYPLGGTERTVLDLLESEVLADLDQRVVFMRGGPLGPFPAGRVLAVNESPGPNLREAGRALLAARTRVLHGWLLRGNAFAAAIGLDSPKAVLLTSERNLGDNLTVAKRLVERFVASREDMCIANSEAVREAAVRRVPSRQRRIRVIRPGIPEPAPAVRLCRFSCVAVGRLEPVKGHELLIRAWPLVLRQHPAATLAIVGEGPQRPLLEHLVEASGVRESVSLIGGADAAVFLRGAELYVSTARSEGFSRAMVEALAVGTPIVATAVGGALELAPEAVRAVPVGDLEATAGAIAELLGSERKRAATGAAGRADYTRRFTLEHCHSAYRDLYAAWLR